MFPSASELDGEWPASARLSSTIATDGVELGRKASAEKSPSTGSPAPVNQNAPEYRGRARADRVSRDRNLFPAVTARGTAKNAKHMMTRESIEPLTQWKKEKSKCDKSDSKARVRFTNAQKLSAES